MGCQQRIAFTALTETDNAVFNPLDMSQGHFGYFLRGGGEGDAVLAVVDIGIFLQGKASQTAGVARFGSRQRGLVAAEKKIFTGRASIGQGAIVKMGPQAVVRHLAAHPLDPCDYLFAGHTPQILTWLGVHLDHGRSKAICMPPDSAICEQGQGL